MPHIAYTIDSRIRNQGLRDRDWKRDHVIPYNLYAERSFFDVRLVTERAVGAYKC